MASGLAGVSKPVFPQKLADFGVAAFNLTDEESRQETRLDSPELQVHDALFDPLRLLDRCGNRVH